ncbi:MAG: energy transducer TonB [Pseudomonadota bacterium]
MFATARAVISLVSVLLPVAVLGQAGPADPQVIAAASTAKINVGTKKLAGQMLATVRVGEDGRVREVQVTENTAGPAFESQLTKVMQSARFRPAIDAAGKPVEASVAMKVELRVSTAAEPKPVAAKPDPELTDKEKARIKKMSCADFVWEWDLIRAEADAAAATEFMPRIATTMYANARTEAGDYVDSKVWKAAPKGLKESAERCGENPQAPFWDGIFKAVMDEAVPK